MTTMPYEKLRLNTAGFTNPRTHSGLATQDLVELAIHIGMHGVLNPPLVLEDGLVIAGQRRYRAIGILIAWFMNDGCGCNRVERLVGHSDMCIVGQRERALDEYTSDDVDVIRRQARGLHEHGVPVRVLSVAAAKREGIALADNLQRSDLSSYEVASYLDHLHTQGATQADLARLIGKSKTYVSRKIAAWRGAGPELLAAWRLGELTDEQVQELAQLPHVEQAKALAAPVPRGRRGPVSRPGIDTVKETLGELGKLESTLIDRHGIDPHFTRGVLDALRWVAGENTSPQFAGLMEAADASVSS